MSECTDVCMSVLYVQSVVQCILELSGGPSVKSRKPQAYTVLYSFPGRNFDTIKCSSCSVSEEKVVNLCAAGGNLNFRQDQ